jgi:hypothetical protein
MKVRDSQRKKVYAWGEQEGILWADNDPIISLDECKKLVEKAITWWFRLGNPPPPWAKTTDTSDIFGTDSDATLLKVMMPRIRVHKRRNGAATLGSAEIRFGPKALQTGVILHETAHILIATHKLADIDGGHGPYFMRVLIELLGHYTKFDRSELTRSAKKNKIKVHLMSKIDRPKSSSNN